MNEYQAKKQYDEFLNEIYGIVKLGPYEYEHADCLKSVDPIAYEEGFKNWIDSENLEVEGY